MVVKQTRKEHVVRDKSENEGINITGDSPVARMADGKCVGRRGAMWIFYCFTLCPDMKLY